MLNKEPLSKDGSSNLVEAVIRRGIERAKYNNSSYKYWLFFPSCRLRYWYILSEDHHFSVIYIPALTKLFYGPDPWSEFITFAEAAINETANGISVAWIEEKVAWIEESRKVA